MHLQIFDNKIIAPNKHGTRFLNQIFNFKYEDANQLEIFNLPKWKTKESYFIYRDPMEHLISALHTEVIVFLEQTNIKEKNDYYKVIENVLNNFIKGDVTHWCGDLLEGLYNMWNVSNKNKFKVIELKNLSPLLIGLGYTITDYSIIDYEFKTKEFWVSKETIKNTIKTIWPDKWEYLMKIVEKEQEFYYKLNNKIIKLI